MKALVALKEWAKMGKTKHSTVKSSWRRQSGGQVLKDDEQACLHRKEGSGTGECHKRGVTTHRKAFQREYELHRAQGDQRMELGQGAQEAKLKGHGDRAKTPSCRCLPL